MLMIALPPFASELVALLIGAIIALVGFRRPVNADVPLETRLSDLTDKVRRPWIYRLHAPRRWMR